MASMTASKPRVTSDEENSPDAFIREIQEDSAPTLHDLQEEENTEGTRRMEGVSNGITTKSRTIRSLEEVATQMATKMDFFRLHAPDIAELRTFPHASLPNYYYCNRENENENEKENTRFELRKRLTRDLTHFPLLPKMGKLQVPMALICEAGDDGQQTLVIINYWRQLKACRQRELKSLMQRFYVRPNVTNERLNLMSAPTKDSALPLCGGSKFTVENKGRSQGRSKPSITPWGFRCLETCTQLAETLGLCRAGENPKHACELLRTANLEFPRSSCKAEDCVYPAIARNHGYCCRHGLHFGPTPGKVNGRRGYLLLGDVYTRPYLAPVCSNTNPHSEKDNSNSSATAYAKKLTTCSCRNETCVGIGYSPTMIQFDIHRFPKDLRDAIWSNPDALNMIARTHFQTSRNKTNDENDADPLARSSVLRLAPWHFHPEHREFLPDGSWKLLESFRSASTNGTATEDGAPTTALKKWKDLPLPTYSLKDFLEEPIMKEYAARKGKVASTTDMLPSWCREYSKLEEGPSSISEVQRNFLWDHSIELEKSLASKTISFRTKERALETELERIRGKYNEKKFLKRRDKKRKRANKSSGNHKNEVPKNIIAGTNGKPSSSGALQERNTIDNNKNRSKNVRNEPRDEAVARNPSDYADADGRTNSNKVAETTKNSGRHDLSSTMEGSHRHGSHRIDPMHFVNHPRQQQQHHHHHTHHTYPHSYPPHPQHHPHHHTHTNRTAPMDLRQHHPQHYHHHTPQLQQQQQQPPQQQQPQAGSYPPHRQQAYHHSRHNERADQYRDQPQEHPPEMQQRQRQHQEQQRQQRSHHFPDQQNWQRRYYN